MKSINDAKKHGLMPLIHFQFQLTEEERKSLETRKS